MAENRLIPATDVRELRSFLEAGPITEQIQKALPSNLTPQRIIRQTLSLVARTPKLLKCTQISILMGLMQAAEMGLELTGPLGHAYLVPRWNGKLKCMEATFQTGWRGLTALAFRSGKVGSMPVRMVYAHDAFDVRYGTTQHIHHIPSDDPDPGPVVKYYTVVNYLSGAFDFEVMTRRQCELHREKFAPKKDGDAFSPWDSSFDEMALKTTTRRLCKRLPLCPEAQAAAMEDEYREAEAAGMMRGAAEKGTRTEEVLQQLEGPGTEGGEEGQQP